MYNQYYDADSPIHKIPAAAKLYGLIGFFLLSMLIRDLPLTVIYLLTALIFFRISLLPVRKTLHKIRYILFLLIVGLIFNLIFSSWMEAVVIFLRLFAVVMAAQVVIMTATAEDLIDALEFSFKMKNEYVVSIMIAISFIPILETTRKEIAAAQSARGYDFAESTLSEKLKGIPAILIPLFRFSIKKAEILGEALTVKGYTGQY